MTFFVWILFGGLVGWVASMLMHTDGQQGILLNVVVGIIGSVIGGWIMNFLGEGGVGGVDLRSFLVALLGACALIAILRVVR